MSVTKNVMKMASVTKNVYHKKCHEKRHENGCWSGEKYKTKNVCHEKCHENGVYHEKMFVTKNVIKTLMCDLDIFWLTFGRHLRMIGWFGGIGDIWRWFGVHWGVVVGSLLGDLEVTTEWIWMVRGIWCYLTMMWESFGEI